MKTALSIVAAVICFIVLHGNAIAEKASGYYYQPNENFPPGIYEAIVDAKVYFDVEKSAVMKGLIIKKGKKISVYSAGYHMGQPPSIDWFDLSDGQECNENILNWKDLGWVGVLKKDFNRTDALPQPIYKNGVITNCVVSIASRTATAGEYLFDLLAKPEYYKSWNTLIRGEKNVDTWLAKYAKTKSGPATPGETIKLGSNSYQLNTVCETSNCGNNTFYVLFAPNGTKAWGLLLKVGEDESFFGNPDDEKKTALRAAATKR
jgi:hypothetical protein